jgi:hypothetical protein
LRFDKTAGASFDRALARPEGRSAWMREVIPLFFFTPLLITQCGNSATHMLAHLDYGENKSDKPLRFCAEKD